MSVADRPGSTQRQAEATAGRLGPAERAADWQRLCQEQFDLLVIGGGVVGSGVALDAATRGLSVALVEARDLASGTSSRSSKLFHGGLRYLEQLEFGLVREALHERELLLTGHHLSGVVEQQAPGGRGALVDRGDVPAHRIPPSTNRR